MKKYIALFIFMGHIIYASHLKLVIAIDVSGSISQQNLIPTLREGYYRLIHNASAGDRITLIAFGNAPRVIASVKITDWHSKAVFIDYFSSLRFNDSWTDFNKLAYFISDKFDTLWQKIILTDAIPAPSKHSAKFDSLMLKKLGKEAFVIKITPFGVEIPDKIVNEIHSLRQKGINIELLDENGFLQFMDNILPLMRRGSKEVSSFINNFDPVNKNSKIKLHISTQYLIAIISILLLTVIGYKWWNREKQVVNKVLEEKGETQKEIYINIIQKNANGTTLKREKFSIPKNGRQISIGLSKEKDTIVLHNDTFVLPRHLVICVDKSGTAKYRRLPQKKWHLLVDHEIFNLSKITDVEVNIVPVEEEL